MTSQTIGTDNDLITDYHNRLNADVDLATPASPRGIDELTRSGGHNATADVLSSTVRELGLRGLLARRTEVRRLIQDDGVTYGAGTGPDPSNRWVIDPLPLVLDAAEWSRVEAGLVQRARLLDALLADISGERRLIRAKVIPPEVIYAHRGFLLPADGLRLPASRQLLMLAIDLARGLNGDWQIIGDRTQAPSGAGYAMANRRIIARTLEGLHLRTRLRRLRGFFDMMHVTLQEAAPQDDEVARVVLLTPGPGSETSYDQAVLSSLLGYPLAQSDDLVMRGGRLWLRTTGRLQAVDVVLRRVDADFCDSLDLRSDSRLGVPGLVAAQRRGTVSVVNPLGAGVLENPGLWPYLDAIADHLMDEDLILRSPQTWWCGDAAARSHVLTHMNELIIKPLARQPGIEASGQLGWTLSGEQRDALVARIEAEPWNWTGQEAVPPSTVPVVTSEGLAPRNMVLRTFGVSVREDYHFLPGGLARVASEPGRLIVTNRSGAMSKDVWVLEAEDARREPFIDRTTITHGRIALDEVVPTGLTPRGAENLYWMGRYAERAEITARLILVSDNLLEDHLMRPDTPGHAAMRAMVDTVAAVTAVPRIALDPEVPGHLRGRLSDLLLTPTLPGSVAYAARRASNAAADVRELLSSDTWSVLSRLQRSLSEAHGHDDELDLQSVAGKALESLLALAGLSAESLVRDPIWAFQDAGRRVERAQGIVRMLSGTLGVARSPVVESSVIEAVMRASDSLITFRRRMAAGVGPGLPVVAAATLLLVDATNPRSVMYQLDRLLEVIPHAPSEVLTAMVRALIGVLRAADMQALCQGGRSGLREFVAQINVELRAISDLIERINFASQQPQQHFSIRESAVSGSPWR